MRRNNLLSGIFWCLIFTLSCTSKSSNSPEVHFINPELNTLHDHNLDLDIEIDVSDDIMIKEYNFWMETDSGFEYFRDYKKVNKSNHKILYTFNLSKNVSGKFSIHLEVSDEDNNKTYKSMAIEIQ